MERKFKVGDRVVATDSTKGQFTKGNTYVVDRLNTYSLGVVADDAGTPNGWGYDCFKLADEGAKVGDKVRCLVDRLDANAGDIFEVIRVFDEGAVQIRDRASDHHTLCPGMYELAPADAAVYGEEPAQPKFKVGDRVVDRRDRNSIARVIGTKDDRIDIVWHGGSIYGTWPASEFDLVESASANDNTSDTTAIVAVFKGGKPAPNARPYVHTSEAAADAEARRLASLHPGQEFGVFVLKNKVVEPVVYAHEWQRFAASGEKIRAIKALREITGLSLVGAKTDVEHWLSLQAAFRAA